MSSRLPPTKDPEEVKAFLTQYWDSRNKVHGKPFKISVGNFEGGVGYSNGEYDPKTLEICNKASK